MLDRRSLDLEESSRFHKIASHFPEFRLAVEHRTEVIIHGHIEVALAIAFIIILHTMPLLRKRTDRLGEEGEFLHEEGEFTFNRTKKFALHSDEVSEVDKFFCEFIGGERFIFWSS